MLRNQKKIFYLLNANKVYFLFKIHFNKVTVRLCVSVCIETIKIDYKMWFLFQVFCFCFLSARDDKTLSSDFTSYLISLVTSENVFDVDEVKWLIHWFINSVVLVVLLDVWQFCHCPSVQWIFLAERRIFNFIIVK